MTTRVERPSKGSRSSGGWLTIVAFALAVGLAAGAGFAPRPATAQPPNHAGLVVQLGDGSVRTYCVAFPEPAITGETLLRRSGLAVRAEVTVLGTTVCRIDETGCDHPREACWCRCRTLGAGCTYWGYNTLDDGRWSFSILGADTRVVRDGDVDGWAWGQGAVATGAQPPVMTFEQLCASAAAAPTGPTAPVAGVPRPTVAPVEPAAGGNAPPPRPSGGPGSAEADATTAPATGPPPTPVASSPGPAEPPTGAEAVGGKGDAAASGGGAGGAVADVGPDPDSGPDREPDRAARAPHVTASVMTPGRPADGDGRPTATADPSGRPTAPADRAALAVYAALVVALASAAWWLRRAP